MESRYEEIQNELIMESSMPEVVVPMTVESSMPLLEDYLHPSQEEPIICETQDVYEVQKDLVKEPKDRWSPEDHRDFEKEMDETLQDGDLDNIKKLINPKNLTKCATNSLEKSFEVCYKLKRLANSKGPDAEDLESLATSVENFAVELLEPLKSDDLKRAIFEREDFDRVSDKAVKYRQKKFVSHPVTFNLMRKRWTGNFYHLKYSTVLRNWIKWFLLHFWTLFDVFLFPVAYGLLWVLHLISRSLKKRQVVRLSFLFNASWKYAAKELETMRKMSSYIMKESSLKSDRIKYATITRDHNGPIIKLFASCDEAIKKIPSEKDVQHPTREKDNGNDGKDDKVFLNYLEEVKNLFKDAEEGSNKVLVIMTDDKFGVPSKELHEAAKSLKQQKIKVIAVGLGLHPEIKELKTTATNDKNTFLIFSRQSGEKQTEEESVYTDEKQLRKECDHILQCIKGNDIFDHYVDYFKTPYFIFFRDTLTYLALLGLHFAMCLQPSTIHFTAIEWIIMLFFLGRFMTEINQVVMERNSARSKRNEEFEADEPRKNTKKLWQKWKELWRIISSYFDDWWNRMDVVTLMVFLVLVSLRVFTWSEHTTVSKNRLLVVAGYLYGLNAMFLTLRVFGHIMESKKSTGSIQIALFQIISAVVAIFGQFIAATLAFSLAITKIYMTEVSYNSGTNETSSGLCENQNGLECWWSSTRYLAWSLLGIPELTPLQSSDNFSDGLAKLLYGVFLIMGVVMLMNMMIALLSNTYQRVEDNALYEWSYKNAITIRTYSRYHPVPVPFNIISLSFMLLRHIYRTIRCTKCQRKTPRHNPLPKKQTREKRKSLFECLIIDLRAEYFAKYGYAFPMAGDQKMDCVLKETEGSHQLIGQIAQRVFSYDQHEKQQLEAHGHPDWDTKGIDIVGQRLIHVACKCATCNFDADEIVHHGAKYLIPLSKEYPQFEVLIQESGERRVIAIGVVTSNYEIHKFPGWEGNTAGYHIDDGRIFDSDSPKIGREAKDAMAYRGDLIGCKILFDKLKDNKLPVSFTLNGRVIGQANLTYYEGFTSSSFYPFVGIACEGISVLFRMCPKASSSRVNNDPVFRALMDIIERLQMIEQKLEQP